MKRYKFLRTCLLLVTLLCFSVSISFAQPERDPERITFGIGVNVYPSVIAGDLQQRFQAGGFADLIAPVQIGPHILIEPELGLYFYTADETLPGEVAEHDARQIVRTGMGAFYTIDIDKSFLYYFGGRLGILSSESQVKYSPQSTVNTNFDQNWAAFYAGAAFGVEYFISSHCSIGAEFQLNHIGYGAPVINEAPIPTVDSTQSVWSTNAALSVRFFFN
jgi:hypothetical protein